MQRTGDRGFLQGILRKLGRLGSAMREKPQVSLDDYILEHFMLYHGLVGTSPENQRRERDVRADIVDAVGRKSSIQLAIALKLPPLYWQERLEKIFSELAAENKDALRESLLPPGEPAERLPEADPFAHPDWRVRANAAKAAATAGITQAIPSMVTALNDETPEMRAAFCHITQSLGQLRTDESRRALVNQLFNAEPWFRVDTAAALAEWPLASVRHDLMNAVLHPHALTDYMSVAIARKHNPAELLNDPDETLQEGAVEIIVGVIQAANGPFSAETVEEVGLPQLLPKLIQVAANKPTPRNLRAVLDLSRWILEYSADTSLVAQAKDTIQQFTQQQYVDKVAQWLGSHSAATETDVSRRTSEQRHAIRLAGEFELTDMAPNLVQNLKRGNPSVNETLDTLGILSDQRSADQIIELINTVVDLNERTNKTLSKQNVFEEDVAGAKTYWHALGALSTMPNERTAKCLLQACKDFAADKRQQALRSLVSIAEDPAIKSQFEDQIKAVLQEGFADPASTVKSEAIRGCGTLGYAKAIPELLNLLTVKDTAVSRNSLEALAMLAAGGHRGEVEAALNAALSHQRDLYKRQRLQAALAAL